MLSSNAARSRDVFICFSKSRPGEAKVALALKDVLEQHGLFAFEYEDWHWVESAPGREAYVDRPTLHRMLTTCSVVVLISPHEGEASVGVQTEIAELRSCGSPVILLHWSPSGWDPVLEPEHFEGLNVVWHYEGSSTRDRDVADNQCEFLARQLGAGSWLACQIHRLKTEHLTTAGALLTRMPEGDENALLNLRLRQAAGELTQSDEAVDISALAADVAARGEPDELRIFVKCWRSGMDLMGTAMADKAQFSLIRPMHMFVTACESLCQAVEKRLGSQELSGDELESRGMALVRLNRLDEAIVVLKQALDRVPDELRYEVFQALALAQEESDLQAAIQSLTSAINCSPQHEITCVLTYNRGVYRTKAGDQAAAVADFSFVVDKCTDTPIRRGALRARARVETELNNYDAAIADYTQVLAPGEGTPRTAISAWMDRAALYKVQHRNAEAIEDLTLAIAAADADLLQRFRSLEARAELYEACEQPLAAASDYEAMAEYMNADREYRDELRRKAAALRRP